MKDLLQEAKRWWRQAESDFNILEIIINAKKYDLVCFLSQQVTEKALKSFLFARGEEIIFTHSIFKLCEMAIQYEPDLADLKAKIKNLDYFYVENRYPNSIEDVIPAEFFSEDDAREAIKMADTAMKELRKKLSDVLNKEQDKRNE